MSFCLGTRVLQPTNTLSGGVYLRQGDRPVTAGVIKGDRHPVIIHEDSIYKNVNDPALALLLLKIQLAELQQEEFDVLLGKPKPADQFRIGQGGLQFPLLLF